MKSFALLVLVAISSPVFARALPKDGSIDAGHSFIDSNIATHKAALAKTTLTTVTATSPATAADATLSASSTVAAKKAHKGKHESATASSPVTTSAAKSKGVEGHHADKGHHKHHSGHNSTLTGSNSTNTALNGTDTALNSTLASSNNTLTTSNSTVAAGTTSTTNTTSATTVTNNHAAGKKHKAKVDKTDKVKPTSSSGTNILNNIIGKLIGRDPVNIARDLPSRHAEDEAMPAV